MGVFDQAARRAAKVDPAGCFHWIMPRLDAALSFHGWLDTRTIPFPGEQDRTCDTVAHFANAAEPDAPWAFVAEFQAEPERDMLERLLEYLIRLRRELRHGANRRGKFRVGALLLNLTGSPQPSTLAMPIPGLAGEGLHWQIVLRTLRDDSAAETLAGIAAGRVARCVLPWIPLMHRGGEASIIEKWKRLAKAEPRTRMRFEYAGLALVLAELAGVWSQWKRALEGWNVKVSQQVWSGKRRPKRKPKWKAN